MDGLCAAALVSFEKILGAFDAVGEHLAAVLVQEQTWLLYAFACPARE
jgi:hypothetical protein